MAVLPFARASGSRKNKNFLSKFWIIDFFPSIFWRIEKDLISWNIKNITGDILKDILIYFSGKLHNYWSSLISSIVWLNIHWSHFLMYAANLYSTFSGLDSRSRILSKQTTPLNRKLDNVFVHISFWSALADLYSQQKPTTTTMDKLLHAQ